MRIAVLAHNLRVAGGLSVGTNIVRVLNRDFREHEYLFSVPDVDGYTSLPFGSDTEVKVLGGYSLLRRLWFERRVLTPAIKSFAPDVTWVLGNLPMPAGLGQQAVLIHDPHLFYPRSFSSGTRPRSLKKQLLRLTLQHRLKAVSLVFCQTQTAADRFTAVFKPPCPVDVLPNAVSELVRNQMTTGQGTDSARTIAKPDRPFTLLCVTRYYAHKNLERIVEAFTRFRGDLEGVRCVLTVSPDDGAGARRLIEMIEDLDLADHITNVGRVQQGDLPDLYRSADAVILPTTLESFSATYLEAMAFHKPILTSDLDFAREVCGDAALYFDPEDAGALTQAVITIMEDEELRDRIRTAGIENLRRWEGTWNDRVSVALDQLTQPDFRSVD